MDKIFELNYTMSVEDFVAFNDHALRLSEHGKKSIRNIRFLYLALGVFSILMVWTLGTDKATAVLSTVIVTVITALWIGLARKMQLASVRARAKKNEKTVASLYSESGTLQFGEEVIIDKSERTELKVPYSTVEKVYITEQAFYFYFGPVQAFVLPLRSFKDYEELKEFSQWIKTKIGEDRF